jgi:hypothetical protein
MPMESDDEDGDGVLVVVLAVVAVGCFGRMIHPEIIVGKTSNRQQHTVRTRGCRRM